MKNQKFTGAIGVEVIVKKGTGRIYFDDIAQLRSKKIIHIDVCDNIQIGKSGVQSVNLDVALDGNITLRTADTQTNIIENLSLKELRFSKKKGNRIAFNHFFDLSKSFIDITYNTDISSRSLYFVFYYNDNTSVSKTCNDFKISNFEIPLKQSRTMLIEEKKLSGYKFKNLLLTFPVITTSGLAGISYATALKCFLTLQKGSTQIFQNIPLILFYQNELFQQLNFDNITFDFTNSYIDIVNPQEADYKSVFFNCIVE